MAGLWLPSPLWVTNTTECFSVLPAHRHTQHGEQMGGIRNLHAVAGLARTGSVQVLLGVFKASLDGALSNMVQWNVSLTMEGGLEIDDF